MSLKIEDRRIKRTREALHGALITLILEKGYDAVTIQDIIERANVGRSTFYAHFTGKEDLLTSGLADLRVLLTSRQHAALSGAGGIAERSLGFSLALFEHAQSFLNIYRALVSERGSALVLNRLRGVLVELVDADLAVLMPGKSQTCVPRSALNQFVVDGLLAVLTWWLDRKAVLPPAEVDAIFRKLVIPSITVALEGK